jgi:hypothetical protein
MTCIVCSGRRHRGKYRAHGQGKVCDIEFHMDAMRGNPAVMEAYRKCTFKGAKFCTAKQCTISPNIIKQNASPRLQEVLQDVSALEPIDYTNPITGHTHRGGTGTFTVPLDVGDNHNRRIERAMEREVYSTSAGTIPPFSDVVDSALSNLSNDDMLRTMQLMGVGKQIKVMGDNGDVVLNIDDSYSYSSHPYNITSIMVVKRNLIVSGNVEPNAQPFSRTLGIAFTDDYAYSTDTVMPSKTIMAKSIKIDQYGNHMFYSDNNGSGNLVYVFKPKFIRGGF